MHRSRRTYEPGRPVTPWVFAIARHVYLMNRRSTGRRLRFEETLAAEAIRYDHFKELGGRRTPRPGTPNAGWETEARWLLAESLEATGKKGEAKKELAKLIATGLSDEFTKKAKEKLKASLVEVVRKTPPPAWKKFMDSDGLSGEEAGRLMDEALEGAFAGVALEFKPTIRWIYKDVTYETIHNPDFRKGLEKSFGAARADKLFSEHDAAPEK